MSRQVNQEPSPGRFYWLEVVVAPTESIIEHPKRFPNKAK